MLFNKTKQYDIHIFDEKKEKKKMQVQEKAA